uniref:LA2681 family HEPN domain-containing protein n=1 Tax=Aeromonas jandaei TaxID=650 RepID=UPI003BA08FD8
MEIKDIAMQLDIMSKNIELGNFDEALRGADTLYQQIQNRLERDYLFFITMSNIASIFIDIGHMKCCCNSSRKGLKILIDYKTDIIKQIGEDAYFYNLSNAKSNLIIENNPFNHSFSTIEQLIEIKSDLWKAIKISNGRNGKVIEPTYMVNLGNCLKRQFRIVEALSYYDQVNSLHLDIPQAWINRSETLKVLNMISNTYSIEMLEQVKSGYEKALLSKNIPPTWIEHYKELIDSHQADINDAYISANINLDIHDKEKTRAEYEELSTYRKFCLDNKLSLSEHGLYCSCTGSSRDNLTIPTAAGIIGDFVIPMEMVLNRLKSEFSFARHLYFQYVTEDDDHDLLHDSCFSELFNDEMLGIDVEKLRTAFRVCFGILDKIGIAICELFDLYPSHGKVYFQSFWQLDKENRRDLFNKVKSPGLLALYSIATDLNDKKEGEWSFLKKLRNDLEHDFVVVHKNEKPNDLYASYGFIDNIVFIQEDEFIHHLKQMLQLTRSAIFSFVFAVRDKALNQKKEDNNYISNEIGWQDYLFNEDGSI